MQPSFFRSNRIIEQYNITAQTAINSLKHFEEKIGKQIKLNSAGKDGIYRCVEFEMVQPVTNKHIECLYVFESKEGNSSIKISSKMLAGKNNYKSKAGVTWIS